MGLCVLNEETYFRIDFPPIMMAYEMEKTFKSDRKCGSDWSGFFQSVLVPIKFISTNCNGWRRVWVVEGQENLQYKNILR